MRSLRAKKVDPTVINILQSFEKDQGVRLTTVPRKGLTKPKSVRAPRIEGRQFKLGIQELTQGMVSAVSNAYGECPRDHRGELWPHWERKDGNVFCQVLVCDSDPNHKFETGLCITSVKEK